MRRLITGCGGAFAIAGLAMTISADANAQQTLAWMPAQVPGPPSASGILFQIGAGQNSSNWQALPGERQVPVFSIGGGVELVASPRMRSVIDAAVAGNPGGCATACAVSGPYVSASVLATHIEHNGSAGVALGPSLMVSHFSHTHVGGGVRIDVGIMRGIGPRVTGQFTISEGGRKFATVHAAIRLGRRFRSTP